MERGLAMASVELLNGLLTRLSEPGRPLFKCEGLLYLDSVALLHNGKCHIFVLVISSCKVVAKQQIQLKIKKGTMKIHAVVGHGNNNVLVGKKSCNCGNCVGGIYNCRHWQPQTMVVISTSQQIDPEEETSIPVFNIPIPEPSTLILELETHIQELETSIPESDK
ncbi:hypothetical protein DPMN_057260 [Dreissena polymorpha]|uniref:Uncharacterized protein n=1 Tax=Dreissena polymorpha TaxID=45954 RepID=A0A9D4CU36_DREPO|nr:hypothetical protein DPMN_057260 [Dreissena polymorpha]